MAPSHSHQAALDDVALELELVTCRKLLVTCHHHGVETSAVLVARGVCVPVMRYWDHPFPVRGAREFLCDPNPSYFNQLPADPAPGP